MSKYEKNDKVVIMAGNKIYSDESVKRYIGRLLKEIKPLLSPKKSKDKSDFKRIKGRFDIRKELGAKEVIKLKLIYERIK